MLPTVDNQVTDWHVAKVFDGAVLKCKDAFADRTGWRLCISGPEDGLEYLVQIIRPDGLIWRRLFFGPIEVNTDFVAKSLRPALRTLGTK